MESLVEGDLMPILQHRGIKITQTSTRRKGSFGGKNFEFDIIAHNGGEIVLVEVKTTLKPDDVKDFVKKLDPAKTWLPEYRNFKICGAVAYLQANSAAPEFAQTQGLLVIRATGNSAAIINEADFVPKAF